MPTTTSSLPSPDAPARVAPGSWPVWAALAFVAWGALAFGAPYPWAYAPLAVACAVCGLVTWCQPAPLGTPRDWPLAGAIAFVAAAILLQLVPLPPRAIAAISPWTNRILEQFSVQYAVAAAGNLPPAAHPLSLDPSATRLALTLFVAWALLMMGLVHALTRADLRRLARGVIGIGVVVALVAIVQRATSEGLVYGFWLPREGGQPFGPFVNRNHFAGWMLMAIPVALGELCAMTRGTTRGTKRSWHGRLLWLGSGEANGVVLAGTAIAIMGLSLVLSMSRSGILGFFLALTVAGWLILRGEMPGSRRTLTLAYVVILAVVAIGWTGTARIVDRFAAPETITLDGRLSTWRDAGQVVEHFPLTGTGLNTYATAALFFQTFDFPRYYNEAHNDYLQLAAEGGVLLAVPILCLLVLFVGRVRGSFRGCAREGRTYWIKAGAVTGLLAIAVQEGVDFSLQMPGNAVLFAVLCAIALCRPAGGVWKRSLGR